MKDENRWKWFMLFGLLLPYPIGIMFFDQLFFYFYWWGISPFYYLVVFASTLFIYDEFPKEDEKP